MPWRPIEGLTDPHGLAVPELRAFTRLWQRQRSRMREHGNLEPFEEQLARRWSIETGVIERLYDISRGATETLVKHGFIASLVAHGEATVDADELMEILGDQPLLLPLDEQEQPQSQRLSAWLETALGHAITRWTDTL